MDEPKKYEWCERLADRFDYDDHIPDGAKPVFDLDHCPAWVVNVLTELMQQQLPAVRLKRENRITPNLLGRILGQQFRQLSWIDERLKVAISQPAECRRKIEKVLTKLGGQPGGDSVVKALEVAGCLLGTVEDPLREQFRTTLPEAFKVVLAQGSDEDVIRFFQGFATGLSKPGVVRNRPVGETTATSIYNVLLVHWREIEKLSSVAELRAFLVGKGLKEPTLGRDPKRLEQICRRMKLSFRPRGRPRKQNNSDKASG